MSRTPVYATKQLMTDVINMTKQAFTWTVVALTIAWSVGLSALMPVAAHAAVCPTLEAGDLIQFEGNAAVYILNADLERMYFPNSDVFHTWFNDFSGVNVVPTDCTAVFGAPNSLPLGVNYRPGSMMVKLQIDNFVYAVEPGNQLSLIGSEEVAAGLYGSAWNTMIRDVNDAFWPNYTERGDDLTEAVPHDGMLFTYEGSDDVWYAFGGERHMVDGDLPAFAAGAVQTVSEAVAMSLSDSGSTFAAGDLGDDPTQGAGGDGTTTPGDTTTPAENGGNVSVALSASSPAAGDILVDSTPNEYPQALVPFVAVRFTAGSEAAVVKTVKFTRTGISADTDLGVLYLYDGNTKLAEYTSFNDKVVSFSNNAGLFTVPANSSRTVWLKGDLARASTSVLGGKKIGFKIAAASDVVINGGAVSGSFPVAGSEMTTVQVADLGDLYVTNTTTFPSTVRSDEANKELWRFTVNAAEQDMEVRYIKFTMVGTIASTDIQNLRLEVAGTQVGSAAEIVNNAVIFDLSDSPIAITAGQNKIVVLRGDMMGGSGRTFKFTIQRITDLVAYDTEYGVTVNTSNNSATGAFALLQPTTAAGTTVSAGTLTIGVATDSPTGNIADNGTNQTLAKFTFDASGEDVKIDSLNVTCNASTNTDVITNMKLLLNGTQVGTTDASATCDNSTNQSFTFSNTFIVDDAADSVLTVVADMSSTTANGTISVSLVAGSSNAQGQVTLGSLSTTAQTGRTLAIKTGTVSVAENSAFGDKSTTNPTGTVNASAVKIASFVITAGSGEAADITQIALADDATTAMANNFQNLKLMHEDTQIGTTVGTLNSTAGTYTFTPASAIRVASGQQYIVDIYADIKSSAQEAGYTSAYAPIRLAATAITATGVSTNANISSGNSATSLQNAYIASNGNLTATVTGDTAEAAQIVHGSTGVDLGSFKLEANAAEDIQITDLTVSVSTTATYQGTLQNLRLYKDGEAFGPAVNLPTGAATTGTFWNASFSGLTLNVPRNSNVVITVKADVSSYDNGATSNAKFHAALVPNVGGGSEPITAIGASSGASITGNSLDLNSAGSDADLEQVGSEMTAYRTKATVAFASDTPSGSSVGATGQTVAKFVVSNSSNAGNYAATVKNMNFDFGNTGVSATAARTLKVYKDSISSSNELASTTYGSTVNITDSVFAEASFTDVEITAGSSKTFIVTLDTNDAGTDDKLSVVLAQGDLTWSDGVTSSITSNDGLPLSAKTLTY